MTRKSARKSRTRTRKPKFLSLRLQLSREDTKFSGEMSNSAAPNRHQQQLNLFPLHPQNPVEDEKLADLFPAADGGPTTLTALLAGAVSPSEEANALSPSLAHANDAQDSEESALVRTAMRNRERDASEERWVCYEEVTSCAADPQGMVQPQQGLSLKLDYEEILAAWCDKGPLYIHLEAQVPPPQTVPDIYDDFLCYDASHGPNHGWRSDGGLWAVPEKKLGDVRVKVEDGQEEEEEEEEEIKLRHREASVLRYKEKRQNRLFSKRIRYEVRKINAEKRPRMKGRFVKRS